MAPLSGHMRRYIKLITVISLSGFLLTMSTLMGVPHTDIDIRVGNHGKTAKWVPANNIKTGSMFQKMKNRILRIGTESDEPDCHFNGTFEENLKKLSSLEFPETHELMSEHGFNQTPPLPNTLLPVFVTGFNSIFFGVAQGLIKSVHEKLLPSYPDLKLIVYDLGLSKPQLETLRKYCKCEVRPFPFDRLPPHVKVLKNFAFKPIVINLVFHEFGSVWWLDSSARFITQHLEKHLEYLKSNGQLFYTYGHILNVAIHTHPDTFGYFREDPCPYKQFGEIEAGNVAFVNMPSTRTILRNWVSCALIAKCISPEGASLGCSGRVGSSSHGICHRFDQSVLSINLRRLYHKQNNYPDWNPHYPVIEIKRGQSIKYFPNT